MHIVTRPFSQVRGTAPRYVSPKGAIKYMKSEQEVAIAHQLDADPHVLRWTYERKSIVYDFKKKLREYFIDFQVHLGDGVVLHLEVKQPGHKPTAMDKAKWAEAKEILGDKFIVVETLEEGFGGRWLQEHKEQA